MTRERYSPEHGGNHDSRSRHRSRSRGRNWLPMHLDNAAKERHPSALSARSVHSHEGPKHKNIPMIWDQPQPSKSDGVDSPLMMIRDQYNIKRPVIGSGVERFGERLPRHMPINLAAPERNSGSSSGTRRYPPSLPLQYQSELDDEEDDVGYPQQWNGVDGFAINGYMETSPPEKQDMEQMLREIDDFQSIFVQKFNAHTPGASTPQTSTSRVQQKVLDYKDLLRGDSSDATGSHSQLSLASIGSESSTSLSYSIKKQHELLTSQYTHIRLRFSSRQHHPGALGFIFRRPEPDQEANSAVEEGGRIHEARTIMQTIWDEELQGLFPKR